MNNIFRKSIYLLFIIVFITGCGQTVYPTKQNTESIIQKIKKDPKLLDERFYGNNGIAYMHEMDLLQYALLYDNIKLAKYLISNNLVDINHIANKGSKSKINTIFFILNKDKEIAQQLIDHKINLNYRDDNGMIAIEHFIDSRLGNINEDTLKLLVKYGLNINNINSGGYTPLHRAFDTPLLRVDHSNAEAIIALINSGAKTGIKSSGKNGITGMENFFYNDKDPNILNGQMPNALSAILSTNNVNLADVSYVSQRTVAHHIAILNSSVRVIEKLNKLKINLNAKDKYGITPLQYAMNNNNANGDVILAIARNGVNINQTYKKITVISALMHQAKYSGTEQKLYNRYFAKIIELIKLGAKTTISERKKILLSSMATNDKKIISYLFNKYKLSDSDYTYLLNESISDKMVENSTIVYLLSKQEIIPKVDISGQNSLHLAIRYRDTKFVREILKYKSNINEIEPKSKLTPLRYAITNASTINKNIIALLIKKGANINEKDKFGNSLLHTLLSTKDSTDNTGNFLVDFVYKTKDNDTKTKYDSVYSYILPITKELVNNGLNINNTNNFGETPLHYFLGRFYYLSDNKSIVNTLKGFIKLGINVNAKNRYGIIPWYYQSLNKIKISKLQNVLLKNNVKLNKISKNTIESLVINKAGLLNWDINKKQYRKQNKGQVTTVFPNGLIKENIILSSDKVNKNFIYATYSRYNTNGSKILEFISNNYNSRIEIKIFNDNKQMIHLYANRTNYVTTERAPIKVAFPFIDQYGDFSTYGNLPIFPEKIIITMENNEIATYKFPKDYFKRVFQQTLSMNAHGGKEQLLYKDSKTKWQELSKSTIKTINTYLPDRDNMVEYNYKIRDLSFIDKGVSRYSYNILEIE